MTSPYLHPIRFHPFHRPMVWGARKLESFLHRHLQDSDNYGESWEISDHPSHLSTVSEGPLQGKTLRDLMTDHAQEILGTAHKKHRIFPWLVKYLDAHDWLSVQVHPDAQKVKTLWPGEGPKNEAWVILDAQPGSRIYAGLLPGVTREQVHDASLSGTVGELLHQFTPRPGDCVYLPAGTVHAVGGGILIAEIQQTSDATFRLFDWNRKDAQGKGRQLHLEESLACIDWNAGPVKPVQIAPNQERSTLVQCPWFQLEILSSGTGFPLGGEGQMQVAMALEGNGTLLVDGTSYSMRIGDTLLFPASMKQGIWKPEGLQKVLLATLPDEP